MNTESGLRLEDDEGCWSLSGPGSEAFSLVNEYLAYLADRNYSPKTVRAYGFDLLAFCRWLRGQDAGLSEVTTESCSGSCGPAGRPRSRAVRARTS
jgi:integrase/recombinase XerD